MKTLKILSKISTFATIICFLIAMVLSRVVFAYELLEPLPLPGGTAITDVSETVLTTYLKWFFMFALAAAAFLAVVQITIAAAQKILAGADIGSQKEANAKINDAITGLLLAFAAWLILYIINPDLAKMNISIPTLTVAPGPQAGLVFMCAGDNVQYTDPDYCEDVCGEPCTPTAAGGAGTVYSYTCWENGLWDSELGTYEGANLQACTNPCKADHPTVDPTRIYCTVQ